MSNKAGLVLQPAVSRIWSITVNNPQPIMDDPIFVELDLVNNTELYFDYTELTLLVNDPLISEIHAQYERGYENNTLHIQCCASFVLPVTFQYVKDLLPTAHIERGRSWSALKRYCSKEDTRIDEPPFFYYNNHKICYVKQLHEDTYVYPNEYACESTCYIREDQSPEDCLVMMSGNTCSGHRLFHRFFRIME